MKYMINWDEIMFLERYSLKPIRFSWELSKALSGIEVYLNKLRWANAPTMYEHGA